MENVVLSIHLILAFLLVGVVLLQRSEGGGLGIGGGSGNGISSRPAVTGLAKVTWGLAAAFIATSVTLTILATHSDSGTSVTDQLGATEAPAAPAAPAEPLTPPAASDAPATPPKAED